MIYLLFKYFSRSAPLTLFGHASVIFKLSQRAVKNSKGQGKRVKCTSKIEKKGFHAPRTLARVSLIYLSSVSLPHAQPLSLFPELLPSSCCGN